MFKEEPRGKVMMGSQVRFHSLSDAVSRAGTGRGVSAWVEFTR